MNLSDLRVLVPNDEVDYLHFEDAMLEKYKGFVRPVIWDDLDEIRDRISLALKQAMEDDWTLGDLADAALDALLPNGEA